MSNVNQILGREQLILWYNDFLSLSYAKIEDTSNGMVFKFLLILSQSIGAAHCQIFDALFPGVVPLYKVNFNATEEYEIVSNFKILQESFGKIGVEKVWLKEQ